MELLDDSLRAYLRNVQTQSTAWDLESYNDLQVASAANGKSLVRNLTLSKVLFAVSPSMVVPYSQLKPPDLPSAFVWFLLHPAY